MKRGNLQRRTPLKADPATTAAFVQRGRGSGLGRQPAVPQFYDHTCACGCDQRIEVKPHHSRPSGGIPRFVVGHNPISPAVSRAGAAASAAARAERAGVALDAPRNNNGHRCVVRVCLVCGEDYLVPPGRLHLAKTCSLACSDELKRKYGGAHRKGAANPNFKTGTRVDVRDRAGERRWYAGAAKACAHCGGRDRLALHHCLYRQHVKAAAGDVWDPRNALTLCAWCHSGHHGGRRARVLPLSVLPDSVFEFAAEVLGERAHGWLRRRYVGEDARLDALREIEAA